MTIQSVFLDAADAVLEAIALPEVAAQWDAPSALEAMTVGAVAAHCVGAMVSIEICLDAAVEASVLVDVGDPMWVADAADYYVRVIEMLDYHDGLDSPGQSRIRESGATFAASGADEVAEIGRASIDRLRPRFDQPLDVPLEVFGGLRMALDPLLETRIAEFTVHLDDLVASPALAGVPIEAPSAEAWAITAQMFATLAIRTHGPQAVVNTLIRPERAPANITVL